MKRNSNKLLLAIFILVAAQLLSLVQVGLSLFQSNYAEFSIGIGLEFIIASLIIQFYLYSGF